MAHVITAEGNIVEGTSLTDEEAKILDAIKSRLEGSKDGSYISARAAASLANYLIANYRITYRRDEVPRPPETDFLRYSYPLAEIPEPPTAQMTRYEDEVPL